MNIPIVMSGIRIGHTAPRNAPSIVITRDSKDDHKGVLMKDCPIYPANMGAATIENRGMLRAMIRLNPAKPINKMIWPVGNCLQPNSNKIRESASRRVNGNVPDVAKLGGRVSDV